MYSATTSTNNPTESTGSTAECYENIYPSSREQRHDERYDGRGTFRDRPDALPDRIPSTWRRKPTITDVTTQFQRRIGILELRVNAVRHIVNISSTVYSSVAVYGIMVIHQLPCCSLAVRHGIYVYHFRLVDYPCIADMHGIYCQFVSRPWICIMSSVHFSGSISSSTVHLRYARHVLSYRCTTLVHSSRSILLRRLPATWNTTTTWIRLLRRNTSSSSRFPLGEELRCGHLLWMPTFSFFLVPFPTERFRTVCHSPAWR